MRVDLKHRWRLLACPTPTPVLLSPGRQEGRKSGVWPYASFLFALEGQLLGKEQGDSEAVVREETEGLKG